MKLTFIELPLFTSLVTQITMTIISTNFKTTC